MILGYKTQVFDENGFSYFIIKNKEREYKFFIDSEDKKRVEPYKWCARGYTNSDIVYAFAYIGGGAKNCTIEFLHRFLLNLSKNDGKVVDHINRNTYDNRKLNLRIADKRINTINRELRKDNTTGVVGVYWVKARNRWRAEISTHNKKIHLGYFENFEEAEDVRREAEEKYFKGIKI